MKLNASPAFGSKAFLRAASGAMLALALLFSCDNTFGVFSEIQTEVRQVGTDQFKNATVRMLGEDGSNYYAAMAKVFKKAKAGGSWAVLSIGSASPSSSYFSLGFAVDQGTGTLYAAPGDLATSSLLEIVSSSDSGSTWTALVSTALQAGSGGSNTLAGLFFAGSTLFAQVQVKSTLKYSLFHYDSVASAFAAVGGLADLDSPVHALVHDGTQFWAATSAKLYKGAGAAALAEDALSGSPSGAETIRGLAILSDGDLAATTNDGQIYTHDFGTAAWSAVEVNDGVRLGAAVEVPVDPSNLAAGRRIILGKHDAGYGYYEWNASASPPSYLLGNAGTALYSQPSSNYTTTVYGKPIQSLYFSDSEDTIFACLAAQGTDGYALYSNRFASGAWSGWTAE